MIPLRIIASDFYFTLLAEMSRRGIGITLAGDFAPEDRIVGLCIEVPDDDLQITPEQFRNRHILLAASVVANCIGQRFEPQHGPFRFKYLPPHPGDRQEVAISDWHLGLAARVRYRHALEEPGFWRIDFEVACEDKRPTPQ